MLFLLLICLNSHKSICIVLNVSNNFPYEYRECVEDVGMFDMSAPCQGSDVNGRCARRLYMLFLLLIRFRGHKSVHMGLNVSNNFPIDIVNVLKGQKGSISVRRVKG